MSGQYVPGHSNRVEVIWNTKLKNAKEYDIIVTGSITIVIFGKDR